MTTTLPDGRAVPDPTAGEPAMLAGWLDFHRETLAVKCSGLDDAQTRVTAVPSSSLTLLGLVQHLAEVERNWFQRVFAGRDVPPVYGACGDTAGGFALEPERTYEKALAVWRREVAVSRELCAGRSLDDMGRLSEPEAAVAGTAEVSLRWILVHLIEEYARHNGHADLLRESIDGVTGP
ncbi:DinB family protein [Streptomyces longisporoflavus]|uniref:DinB family protein n=1 Tax=Streptomyces longisporoflavus TaxID=28044 RepID=A0ABW7QMT4_9ACTN